MAETKSEASGFKVAWIDGKREPRAPGGCGCGRAIFRHRAVTLRTRAQLLENLPWRTSWAVGAPLSRAALYLAEYDYTEIADEYECEVDHRVPLWRVADLPDAERLAYFLPGNLWLLHPLCHAAKTAREARERAEMNRRDSDTMLMFGE